MTFCVSFWRKGDESEPALELFSSNNVNLEVPGCSLGMSHVILRSYLTKVLDYQLYYILLL